MAITTMPDMAQAPASIPSCAALQNTCGPAGKQTSCCDSPAVEPGMYFRSYDVAGDGLSGDQSKPAMIYGFGLDRYEVTVGRFRAFVESGHGTQEHPPAPGDGTNPVVSDSGWNQAWNANLPVSTAGLKMAIGSDSEATWTDKPGPNENVAMNAITWFEAMAFCAWDGGYLPTEAEWNYAAAGGSEQRAYPWATAADPLALDATDAVYGMAPSSKPTTVGSKSPTGDGKWGQSDLAGNVFEWVLDSFQPYNIPCNDCANMTLDNQNPSRVTRGGSYGVSANSLRTSVRIHLPPTQRDGGVGVRCARALSVPLSRR